MKKLLLFLLICLSTIITVAQQLEITVINVGQGDSIFIKAPNNLKILIDAGTGGDADATIVPRSNAYNNIMSVLKANGVSPTAPLDYLIISHFHTDHYGYVDNIVKDFGAPKIAILDRGGSQKWSGSQLSNFLAEYLLAVETKRNPYGVMAIGAKIDLGNGGYLQLMALGYPDEIGAPDKRVKVWGCPDVLLGSDIENSKSMVFILRWNGFDTFLGGDTTEKVEPALAQVLAREHINTDVFKVSHHGSDSSNSGDFLSTMQPEVAICSVGNSAIYKHPRQIAYDNLYNRCRCFIFQTDLGFDGPNSYSEPPVAYGVLADNSIQITFDGKMTYQIKFGGQIYSFFTDDSKAVQ